MQREDKFFSIDITHVITTRPIPSKKDAKEEQAEQLETENEQPQTINPSLLSRPLESGSVAVPTIRRLFENECCGE